MQTELARPKRGLLETGAEDQRCRPAAFPAESAGVRACAERPPHPRTFRSPRARARAREAKVHSGLGAAAARQGAFPRGRPRPLSAPSYPPSFPRGSCTEVVAGASPVPRLARPAGAMAAFSKYLTARNSSLAGAAFLLLCLLHKRRRALGLHG